ncbi:MAG TPA: ParB/RepB/Spo0J family partition protein [Elusimicrobiales bacterium]|nr:ParB/RepB/Spo0J family partition protein [Elusimicrobiales bacterium]
MHKEYEMNLGVDFLLGISEFDRTDPSDQINLMWYNSETTINSLARDIKNGTGIKEAVNVIVKGNKALLIDGCHRVAAAKMARLNKLSAIVRFFKGDLGEFKSLEHKMKVLNNVK